MNIFNKHLQIYFENSKFPVYVIDEAYKITYTNSVIDEKYKNIIGDKCFYALYNRTKPCNRCIYNKTLKENDINISSMNKKENLLGIDSPCVLDIGVPISYKENKYCIIMAYDDTKKHLNYEVYKNELEGLKERLFYQEEIQNDKEIYFVNQAHSLSGYINNINFRVEQLQREYPEISLNDNLQGIESLIIQSKNTLQKMFQFTEINHLEVEAHAPFDFHQMIGDIRKRYTELSRTRNVRFKTNISGSLTGHFIGDVKAIKQMISNILDNAFDFTVNGDIRLNIYPINQNHTDTELMIVISDTGIGIPKEHIDQITKRFYKVQKKVGGDYIRAGLGLSISKALLERMQGDMSIESELGKGTKVSIRLTLKNKDIRKDLVTKDSSKEIKILMIGLKKVFKLFFNANTSKKYKVILAEDGEKGLLEYYRIKPDIVIIEVMSKGINAFEFLDELDKTNAHQAYVIASSNQVIEQERDYLINYGFDEYLPRPIEYQDLIDLIYALEEKKGNYEKI